MVLALTRLESRVQSNIGLIRAGVARNMTSSQIQGLIRATGQPGIRRTDLLAGIRHARGIAESGTRIQFTRRDRFPDPARISPARGPMISNFSYDVRVRARDSRTGELVERFITVRSDRNLTPGQIREEAQRAMDEAPEEAESGQLQDVTAITVVGARRR